MDERGRNEEWEISGEDKEEEELSRKSSFTDT